MKVGALEIKNEMEKLRNKIKRGMRGLGILRVFFVDFDINFRYVFVGFYKNLKENL